MRSSSLRGKVTCLLVATALVVPWCANAGPRPETAATRLAAAASSDFLSRLWHLATIFWSDIGCHLDPSGGCRAGVMIDQPETGCHLDPHGGCRDDVNLEPPETTEGDIGCHIDPHGNCGG